MLRHTRQKPIFSKGTVKKFVFVASTLLGLCSIGSASTSVVSCIPSPSAFLGQANGGSVSCPGFTTPGGSVLTSITFEYTFDLTINRFTAGSSNTSFSFDLPGTALDVSDTANESSRPVGGTIQILAGFGDFTSPFNIAHSYSGATARVTGATFNETLTYAYEAVPEPASYALMGLGISALAFIRRRQQA